MSVNEMQQLNFSAIVKLNVFQPNVARVCMHVTHESRAFFIFFHVGFASVKRIAIGTLRCRLGLRHDETITKTDRWHEPPLLWSDGHGQAGEGALRVVLQFLFHTLMVPNGNVLSRSSYTWAEMIVSPHFFACCYVRSAIAEWCGTRP